ncbi:unnamed protein product [Closterium sp. NIES-53]
MASLRVLSFDNEGRPIPFDTWLDDLQLYQLSDSRDSVSLFDHTSGTAPAPPATADSATRSQWLTRDAAARLAIRNHLPLAECAHFGQHKTARALYDAVVACYSSPATAALGCLLLPYLFPELDHFLALDPTNLTFDLLKQHLLAAETSVVTVGAARGTPPMPFFEGCSPSPLAPSYASAPAVDVLHTEDVGAASAGASRRSGKGKDGRGGGGGSESGGGGSSGGSGGSGGGGSGGSGGGSGGVGGGGGGSSGSGGSGNDGNGGQRQRQQRRSETPSPQQLREWLLQSGASGGSVSCPYVIRTGDRAGQTCGKSHTQHRCFSCLDDAWRAEFGDEVERPHWAELLSSGVTIFDLDFDAILSAMYAFSACAEGDCYRCVPPDPGIEAAALGASESSLPGTAPAEALHTFTLDSGASRCFFRDSTTLTPLPAPVSVRLADPSGGAVVARSSTVLPVRRFRPAHCQVFTSPRSLRTWVESVHTGYRASSGSCVCSGVCVRSLPPLLPSPAPPCLPCVEERQRAAPHSSSFPPTTTPLQTLHMDVWGPARVSGRGRERYFLLVVDDYTRYTTDFPVRSKGQVVDVLIPWIRAVPPHWLSHGGRSYLHDPCGCSHFRWPFAVQYAAHQLNLWPRVSFPETLPTLRWTGKVGDASVFRVWGSRAFVCDTSADKLSARAIPCDVTFHDSVPFYRLFPYRSTPPPPPPLFLAPGPPLVDPLPPQGPAPSGVSQVDPLSGTAPVEEAVGSCATSGGAAFGGAELGGAGSGGAEPWGVESGGAGPGREEHGGAEPAGVEPGGAESVGVESGAAEPRGAASSGGPCGASPRVSPQQLREWLVRRACLRSGATRAGGTGAAGARGVGVTTGAGGPGGTAAAGPGGARTRGSSTGGAGAGGAGAGGAGARGAGARGPGAGDDGAGGAGVGGSGAGAGAGEVDPGGTVWPRPYFVPLLQQVLGVPSSTILTPPLLCPPPDQSQLPLQPVSPLPAPSPYTEQSGGLTERREPASRPVSPVCTAPHVPRSRPPPVPGTHAMALRPSSVPLPVPLPAPPASSFPEVPDPESDHARTASPIVFRLLATAFTDPSFESAVVSALVAELLDFAAACRLDYATALVAESESASPPSVGAAVPRFTSMLLPCEGDPDAPDIPTPRSYVEAIKGPYSSTWQAAMDAEMASWKSTGTYVDEVPPPGANIVDGMWIFRVKRLPGSPPTFKARYVARGFSQRQGVDYFQTFSPTPKMTTLRVLLHVATQCDYELHSLDFSTAFLQGSLHEEIWLRRPPGFTGSFLAGTQTTLAALGFAPSTADPSLFLRTDTSLPPFYVLVYITRDKARRTITLTQSHMVPSSSCEAEIYAGAMAAQELRWLTYLLTDLGEQPRFQRGQLRLAYVATKANTADIFTKALPPRDHQRFSTVLGLVPTLPHLLIA